MNATLSSLLSVVGLVGSMVISTEAFATERPTAYTTVSGAVGNPTYAYDASGATYANVNTARSCAGNLQPVATEVIEFYGFSGGATMDLTIDHTLSITLDAGWGSTGAAASNGTFDIGLDYSVDGGSNWIPIRAYLGIDAMNPAQETLTTVIAGGTLADLEDLVVRPRISVTPNAGCTRVVGSISGTIAMYDITLN